MNDRRRHTEIECARGALIVVALFVIFTWGLALAFYLMGGA